MAVEVEVKSQLTKIIEDLQKIQQASEGVTETFKGMGEGVGKAVKQQNKEIQGQMEKTQSLGRRVADQLRKDFSSLMSLQSLSAGLKLSDQFKGSIGEAVNLSDTVRRLGSIFGIAQKDFISFQTKLQYGLGQIGLSSDAAANALKGLAETPVRGEANLIAYAKTAGQLASISGQRGSEGEIAKGASGILTARGGNPNDLAQLSQVSNEILQIRKATGHSVTEITSALASIYSKTNKDFQSNLKNGGSTSIASASLLGGAQATAFIEKYLSMNRIERKGLEAQGFGNIVGKNGELNTGAISRTMAEAKSRGMGDAQAGLKTFGFGDEEAKGFIRLADAIEKSGDTINHAKDQVVNINEEYRKSMGLGDAFRANINKIKGVLSPAISAVSQGATSLLGKASESGVGAGVVTAGSAVLAAVLAGGGLRGIGKGLLGGEAKSMAIEAATGEHVQRVEVINFPSGFGSSGGGLLDKAGGVVSKAAGLGGIAATAGTIGTVASAGVAAGEAVKFIGEGGLEDAIRELVDHFKSKDTAAPYSGALPQTSANIKVELKSKDLKAAVLPGRGARQ